MAKILILIGSHICTAPRPQKEAQLLANRGHDVTVSGVWFDPDLIERDRRFMEGKNWHLKPALNFEPAQTFNHFLTRAKRRIALQQFTLLGLASPPLFGYGAKNMLQLALSEKADLTIVHSEAGLWVGDVLLHRGYRVGIDFEDWFTEDLPEHARRGRHVRQMRRFEQQLAEACTYCLCTSHAVAREMAHTFNVKKPTVIYNSFPWSERSSLDKAFHDRKERTSPSLHWFSQTIGKGRGLESLFLALTRLEHPVQIHLRGKCSHETREWIKNAIPFGWHDRVFIHPTVPNDDLLSRISEHDIGLAIEPNTVKNRDLTVTNKLFQYMLGGLAVIATDTQGQTEIMSQWASDEQLVPCDDPHALAKAINWLLESRENLQAAKKASLQAARNLFSWEHQLPQLERLIDETLASRSDNKRA